MSKMSWTDKVWEGEDGWEDDHPLLGVKIKDSGAASLYISVPGEYGHYHFTATPEQRREIASELLRGLDL